jgi:hypothetical protein
VVQGRGPEPDDELARAGGWVGHIFEVEVVERPEISEDNCLHLLPPNLEEPCSLPANLLRGNATPSAYAADADRLKGREPMAATTRNE